MESYKTGEAYVVKHTGSQYLISELPKWDLFAVVIRGKLRLKDFNATNPVAVGDIVEYEVPVNEDGRPSGVGVIKNVCKRKNYIIRKSTNLSKQAHILASNIDMAYLVVTLDFPETKLPFIDRFLVSCQAYKIPVKIILNKIDLYDENTRSGVEYFKEIYNGASYEVLEVSALDNIGIDQLRGECAGDGSKARINLFSGVSGVGKSSLIKALDPSLNPKTGQISEYHLQGKHTTTFYEMYKLSSGGFIVDTPGIRGFGLVDFKPEELSLYFPEMFSLMENCHFKPCTHTHEPRCAVKDALERDEISAERYNSYLGMLDEEGKYR